MSIPSFYNKQFSSQSLFMNEDVSMSVASDFGHLKKPIAKALSS
jgi:hypothetical protein